MNEESLLTSAPVQAAEDNTTINESTSETTSETTSATTAPEGWFLSEEIAGQGDSPDWFKSGKYKTVADQAKAYAGLESKLGSFTGAPEDGYTVEMPEGVDAEFAADDPLLVQFNEWAGEAGLSQDAHSKLLSVYVNNIMESMPVVEDEINKIGKDAAQRIEDLSGWGRHNLSEAAFETMQGLATTAEGFLLLEDMRSKMKDTQISAPDRAKPVNTMSEERLYEMVADPRYESSPSYRSEVEAKFKDYFGSQPASNVRQ